MHTRGQLKRLGARARDAGIISLLAQPVSKQLRNGRIVFHNQYFIGTHFLISIDIFSILVYHILQTNQENRLIHFFLAKF